MYQGDEHILILTVEDHAGEDRADHLPDQSNVSVGEENPTCGGDILSQLFPVQQDGEQHAAVVAAVPQGVQRGQRLH